MSAAPQLHLTLPTNTTSFKRSFEQFGFDLESPVGSSGSELSASGSSGESERNKRARSASSYDDESTAVSSSSGASALSNTRPESLTVAERPPRLPTPIEIQNMDIDIPTNAELDLPQLSIPSPFPVFDDQTQPPTDVGEAIERFHDFDSQIAALRRSPPTHPRPVSPAVSTRASPIPSLTLTLPLRHRTPPPTLPPLELDVEPAPPTLPPLPPDTSSLNVPFLDSLAESGSAPSSPTHENTVPRLPVPTFFSSDLEEEQGFSSALDNVIRPSSPLRFAPLGLGEGLQGMRPLPDQEREELASRRRFLHAPSILMPHDSRTEDADDPDGFPRWPPPRPHRTSNHLRPSLPLSFSSRRDSAIGSSVTNALREREERWERLNSALGADHLDDTLEEEDTGWRGRYVENGLLDPREAYPDRTRSSDFAPRLPLPSSLNNPPPSSNTDYPGVPPSLFSEPSNVSNWLSRTRRAFEEHGREYRRDLERERERRRRIILGFNGNSDEDIGIGARARGSPVLPPLALHTGPASSNNRASSREDEEDEAWDSLFGETDGTAGLRERWQTLRNRGLYRSPLELERDLERNARVRRELFRQGGIEPSRPVRRAPRIVNDSLYGEDRLGRPRDPSPPGSWSEFSRRYGGGLPAGSTPNTREPHPPNRRPFSWTAMSASNAREPSTRFLPMDLEDGEQREDEALTRARNSLETVRTARAAFNRLLESQDDVAMEDEDLTNRPPTIPLPDLGDSPFREEPMTSRLDPERPVINRLRFLAGPSANAAPMNNDPWSRSRRRYVDVESYLPGPFRNALAHVTEPDPEPERRSQREGPNERQHPPTIPPLSFQTPTPGRVRRNRELWGERDRTNPSSFRPMSFPRRNPQRPLDAESDMLELDEPAFATFGPPDRSRLPSYVGPNLTQHVASRSSTANTGDRPSGVGNASSTPAADVHSYFNRHIRIEASRLEALSGGGSMPTNTQRNQNPPRVTRGSGDFHGLHHALEVLRGDGLSEMRQRQLVSRYQQDRRGQTLQTNSNTPASAIIDPQPSQPQFGVSRPPRDSTRDPWPSARDGRFADRPSATFSLTSLSRRDFLRRAAFEADFLAGGELGFGRRRRGVGFNFGDFVSDEDWDNSYETLVNLGSILGEVRPRGTPEDVVAGFDKAVYEEWATSDSDQRCPICLDDYKPSDPVLRLPNCTHWLHKECLEQWLKGANTCPVCRNSVSDRPDSSRPLRPRHRRSWLSGPRPNNRRSDDDRPPPGDNSNNSTRPSGSERNRGAWQSSSRRFSGAF